MDSSPSSPRGPDLITAARLRLSRLLAGMACACAGDAAPASEPPPLSAAPTAGAAELAAEAVLDALPAALLALGPDNRVRRANWVAATWLAPADGRLCDRHLAELARGEPWLRALELADAARAGGREATTEVRDATGRAWDLHADAAPGAGRGTVILSVRDVTRTADRRERLRRNQSVAALGTLVAGVAQEVRQSLRAIAAQVEVVAADGGLLPQQAASLAPVRVEVKRLEHLAAELLEFGRPDPPDVRALSVTEVLRNAADACGPLGLSRGVSILCGTVAATVLGDAARLQRVFANLVENAVQHSAPGGMVEISATLHEWGGQRVVECRVADRGPGFAPADLSRAFEPFFTRRPGGTGLGLPIVQRLVAEHGGTVAVGNRDGGGAYTLVRLPVRPPA